MIDKLTNELRSIGISLDANTLNPEFSDYVIKFNERIIGYGWKKRNVKENAGFMGWAKPSRENCVWREGKMPENLDFVEVINLFQFALSEDYIWLSLPTNNSFIGYTCEPYNNMTEFVTNLKRFIENEFDPKIFLQ